MKKFFYLVCIAFVAFFCLCPTGLNSQLNGGGGSLGGGSGDICLSTPDEIECEYNGVCWDYHYQMQ